MSKKKIDKNVVRRLLIYTKPYRGYLIAAMVSALISVLLTLTVPVLIGDGVDCIVGAGDVDYKELLQILILLGASVAGTAVFQWLMSYFTNVITYRTVKDLRIQLFQKLNGVPLRYIDRTAHGDFISRVVNDIDQVSDGLLQGFTQLFTGIITIVVISFLNGWNDLVYSMTFNTSPNMRPLTANIYKFQSAYGTKWNCIMAYGTILVIPVVLMFIFLQKYIVGGLTAGAVKE